MSRDRASRRTLPRLLVIWWALGAAAAAGSAHGKPPAPDVEDVAYGPHERNVLDVWWARSDKPTPLVIFIHGGGFRQGDKRQVRGSFAVDQCLHAGVSFAAINYRFRDRAPIQDILRDAARAVQYIRSRASEWNIDPARIAAYGGSAGAGTSLWLAFHDDLADPNSDDPVLRQSSRLAAAGSLDGQVSYDIRDWDTVLGPSTFKLPEADWLQFYGFRSKAESESPESDKIMKDCGMLGLISKDDPPVAVACHLPAGDFQNGGHYVHHPKHSIAIAQRCKQHGVQCLLLLSDGSKATRADQTGAVVTFLIEKLGSAVRSSEN